MAVRCSSSSGALSGCAGSSGVISMNAESGADRLGIQYRPIADDHPGPPAGAAASGRPTRRARPSDIGERRPRVARDLATIAASTGSSMTATISVDSAIRPDCFRLFVAIGGSHAPQPTPSTRDPGHRRRTRGRRGHAPWRTTRESAPLLRRMPRPHCRTAGAGRLRPGGGRSRRGAQLVDTIVESIRELAPLFPHDAEYLAASTPTSRAGSTAGFGVPDFLDSLVAFQPQQHRVDGIRHLVVFPMYTQNGSRNRHVEALVVEVIWPEFIAELETAVHEPAVRLAAARRLHARLRHELSGAVSRDGRDARGPDVHLGSDLPGPRGRALPPRRARGGRDHQARAARAGRARCSTTRSSPRRPS